MSSSFRTLEQHPTLRVGDLGILSLRRVADAGQPLAQQAPEQ